MKASRPHASATQIEWIPAASAIFARSIVRLEIELALPIHSDRANLRAIVKSSVVKIGVLEIAHPLVPSHDVFEIFHHRKVRRD